jgi:hypothetical protein
MRFRLGLRVALVLLALGLGLALAGCSITPINLPESEGGTTKDLAATGYGDAARNGSEAGWGGWDSVQLGADKGLSQLDAGAGDATGVHDGVRSEAGRHDGGPVEAGQPREGGPAAHDRGASAAEGARPDK